MWGTTVRVEVPWVPGARITAPCRPAQVMAIAQLPFGELQVECHSLQEAVAWLSDHANKPQKGLIILTYLVRMEA